VRGSTTISREWLPRKDQPRFCAAPTSATSSTSATSATSVLRAGGRGLLASPTFFTDSLSLMYKYECASCVVSTSAVRDSHFEGEGGRSPFVFNRSICIQYNMLHLTCPGVRSCHFSSCVSRRRRRPRLRWICLNILCQQMPADESELIF